MIDLDNPGTGKKPNEKQVVFLKEKMPDGLMENSRRIADLLRKL